MRAALTALCLLMPLPAMADVAEVVKDHILPGYNRLVAETDALAELEQAHLQRLAELNIQPELGVPGSLVE